jgi:hypothetical protein
MAKGFLCSPHYFSTQFERTHTWQLQVYRANMTKTKTDYFYTLLFRLCDLHMLVWWVSPDLGEGKGGTHQNSEESARIVAQCLNILHKTPATWSGDTRNDEWVRDHGNVPDESGFVNQSVELQKPFCTCLQQQSLRVLKVARVPFLNHGQFS